MNNATKLALTEPRDMSGEEVRYAILHLNMTIKEFARATGYKERTIHSWLMGERMAPGGMRYIIAALRKGLKPFEWTDIEDRLDEVLAKYETIDPTLKVFALTGLDMGMITGCAKNDPAKYTFNQDGDVETYRGVRVVSDPQADINRFEARTLPNIAAFAAEFF